MKRILSPAALLVLALAATSARAQFTPGPGGGPGYYPKVSPYLNLLNQNTDPAISLYGIVRPELSTQRALLGLQQDINAVGAQSLAGSQGSGLLATGHPTRFFNYSHYFGNQPGSSTGGSQGRGSGQSGAGSVKSVSH